jgi:predicted nuclease of restriction endonuclease-like (RecB) superfamily
MARKKKKSNWDNLEPQKSSAAQFITYVASDRLYRSVRKVIQEAQGVVSRVANWAMVESNWRIGFLIVEDEQKGKRKAEYGKAVLKDLASRLTAEYGSGYDESNLRYMRLFYLAFPIRDALRHELSWTHYRSLTRVADPIAREWYMNECIASSWGTRVLDRQIATQSYERLLSDANPDRRRKRKELPLTKLPDKPKSLVPADFIKNPMLLEFLSLPAEVKIRETKLESALISHLKDVLMELGRGFCFVARQKHMRTESDDFFIDLVFYNSILKCYFLIDLKVGRVTHQDVGQMDMYRRMYDELVKQPDDNPTIGIVLCSETDQAIARYSILKGNEKLFAVKYKTYLPDEETLRREIEAQKELYRLQIQSMAEIETQASPSCVKSNAAKKKTRKP